MSHMTINGAKDLIDIEGLPEMPIQALRISDVIGTGEIGMKATYTDGLELHDVELNPASGPAFTATRSNNLELDGVSSRKPASGFPVVRLEDTPGAVVRNCRAFPGTSTFLSTPKGELEKITLQGNVLANAKVPTE